MLKAIHIAKSLKNQPHEPKLVNKYVFANASKFAERKARHTTIKLQYSEVRLQFIVAGVGLLASVVVSLSMGIQ
jgi:hypothetical protein